jgi:hypothetical protein
MLALIGLAVLAAVGWYGYQGRDSLGLFSGTSQMAAGPIAEIDRAGLEIPPFAGLSGTPASLDATLQATPLWRVLKREFPDWYGERLREIARLAGQNKSEEEIAAQVAGALVALRRENAKHGLVASYPHLRTVATTFYENLVQLKAHDIKACSELISQGEASPAVVTLLRGSEHTARLQAQLTAMFEAIADGRKAVRTYPVPRDTDYNVLRGHLAKRGWTQADQLLFTDANALSRAGPEKLCRLVQDWFAAQLAIGDGNMQLRLFVETLQPLFAG